MHIMNECYLVLRKALQEAMIPVSQDSKQGDQWTAKLLKGQQKCFFLDNVHAGQKRQKIVKEGEQIVDTFDSFFLHFHAGEKLSKVVKEHQTCLDTFDNFRAAQIFRPLLGERAVLQEHLPLKRRIALRATRLFLFCC